MGKISSCCSAEIHNEDSDLCPQCKEHCSFIEPCVRCNANHADKNRLCAECNLYIDQQCAANLPTAQVLAELLEQNT